MLKSFLWNSLAESVLILHAYSGCYGSGSDLAFLRGSLTVSLLQFGQTGSSDMLSEQKQRTGTKRGSNVHLIHHDFRTLDSSTLFPCRGTEWFYIWQVESNCCQHRSLLACSRLKQRNSRRRHETALMYAGVKESHFSTLEAHHWIQTCFLHSCIYSSCNLYQQHWSYLWNNK